MASDESSPLAESLRISNWGESRFAKFVDGEPLSVDEHLETRRLAHRLATFSRRLLVGDAQPTVSGKDIATDPKKYRGQLVRMKGQVVALLREPLDEEEQLRWGVPTYYQLQVACEGDGGAFAVVTPNVPKPWLAMESVSQPVEVVGIFVKVVADDPAGAYPIVVAPQIAWSPVTPDPPSVNFGMSVLGVLGVDVGKLDAIVQRKPLVAADSDAFYAILSGVRTIGAQQLVRSAERRLPEYGLLWESRMESAKKSGEEKRWAMASEVVSRAKEERYSVAPFFNDPANHVGQLVTFDGLCRRAVRIVIDDEATAAAAGVDHYYELDLYTDDSQHLPLVFCMLEVPPEFPLGENLHEPVRVAGFFFKSWRYTTRRTGADQVGMYPLFIGRAPLRLVQPEDSIAWGWISGIGFVLVLAAIWLAQWFWSRSDRKFATGTMARLAQPIDPVDFTDGVESPEDG